MGGYGSGHKFYSAKTTVEDCRSIDATRWQREKIFRPSYSTYGGRWVWSDPHTKEERASIGYQPECDETFGSVRLNYSITREGGKIPLDYPIRLTTTKTPWGKVRWWFICPLVVDGRACGRRVRKLYLPGGGRYFGCRHCYNLTYTSCQESHKYDACLTAVGAPFNHHVDDGSLFACLPGRIGQSAQRASESFRSNPANCRSDGHRWEIRIKSLVT